MKTITILLADDHGIVREGIRKMLEAEPDFLVTGEAETGHQAIEMAVSLQPNVIIMDIAMPLLNGLEACRQLVRVQPQSRILMLSAHADDAYVERAIESGAAGFILKLTSGENLALAIRAIHAGKQVFSNSIGKRSSHQILSTLALTSRETEVLQLIAEGKANKEMAGILKISVKTVEKHRNNLMKKLHIHETASLTRYAISAGIIESSVQKTDL